MVTINVSANVDNAAKQLQIVKTRQIPFATSLAINRTVQKVKERQIHEMRDVFDRPKPFTLNSVFIKPSNKTTLTAKVGLKDFASKGNPASKYLRSEITGGVRRLKAYEIALRSAGILPSNYFTVPGKGAQIDMYGNVQKSQINKILSYLQSFKESGHKSNATDKTKDRLRKGNKKISGLEYFVIKPDGKKGLPPGIWRNNLAGRSFIGAVKPRDLIFMFVSSVNYEAIYDFRFVAETAIKKNFDNEFRAAVTEANNSVK